MIDAASDVRIDPKEIPKIEMKLLCATILDAVIESIEKDRGLPL